MRHDSQAIETGRTGPKDLGRLEPVDVRSLRQGQFLWGRFHVVGEPRERASDIAVAVQDADGEIGEAPTHRLDLHLFPVPAGRDAQARLKHAWTIRARGQARVFAVGHVDGSCAVFAEPAGDEVELPLDRGALLELGVVLSGLLSELHRAGIHGVRFGREQLRVDDRQYSVEGFDHIQAVERPASRDVDELQHLLRDLAGDAPTFESLDFADAGTLYEHLRAIRPPDAGFEFELPTELPFVGRTEALAAIEAAIAQAHIAKPTSVVVRGARGVGKSRLLREFVSARLAADDAIVLTGAWQPESGDTRTGLLGALEQLPRVLPRLDPDERHDVRRRITRATKHLGAIVTRSAPALGAVLRHAEELPQLELGGDFSRHTAVIADVLKSIGTRQRPLVLVLDNVEGADANSAAILDIVTQSRPAHYTLVVMGLRTGGVGYEPSFDCERIDLEPLDPDAVTELLERTLPGEIEDTAAIGRALLSASSGLPLALGATLRSWLERGRLVHADGIWRARKALRDELEDEPNVRSLFKFRLAGASESVKIAALRIAVIGVELRKEYIPALDPEIELFVSDLCERGILVRTDWGVRFPHDSVRELVLDWFKGDEAARREAHSLAADVLAKHGAPISQVIYHRDLGFDLESATAAAFDKLSRLHVEAGRDRLDVYDLERARWHLERALEHSHDVEQRGLAAEGLADICLLQEDLDYAVSLYTAIIATAEPAEAVRVAAKVVQFLYGKSANSDALQLGYMALETAGEPTPTSSIGKLWTLLSSVVRPWFGPCKLSNQLRDGLCRLYMYLLYIALIDDPLGVPMYAARGRLVAIGLQSGPAAVARSLEAGVLTVLGFARQADEIFALSTEIAKNSGDAWSQGLVFHHWGGALLALDRYSDGQDRLDDAIGAFRETGDVSIALLSMTYKTIYARDREHADIVLGWIEEALITARRNGKRAGVPSLQSVKLHILARQGRTDLDERLAAQVKEIENEDIPGIEQLIGHIQLAYAYLEIADIDVAYDQALKAQALADEMGGTVPEQCQEVHYIHAMILLARGATHPNERKALRKAVRRFKRVVKRAPRLRVFNDVLQLKLALHTGQIRKAQTLAAKIVSEFEVHENLSAARQAHRALARLLKGDNVLAAAEHERVARNLGRRMGLGDHVLLSDFSDIGREVDYLALTEESSFQLEESHHDVPAAAMLSASSVAMRTGRSTRKRAETNDEQFDVLEAWALTGTAPLSVSLGAIIPPVRAAVSASIPDADLDIRCVSDNLEVPVASGDLQVLLINMLLACRDAVGSGLKITAMLDELRVDGPEELSQLRVPRFGRYLSIFVSARGQGTQIPVIGAYSQCDALIQGLGGVLSASTDRGRATLRAYIILDKNLPPDELASPPGVMLILSNKAVVETIGGALDELGVPWREAEETDVKIGELQDISVILADTAAMIELEVLKPLVSARFVEVIKRGTDSTSDGEVLRVPFSLSELEERIR